MTAICLYDIIELDITPLSYIKTTCLLTTIGVLVGGWITSLIPDFATESKASTIENTKIDVAVDVIADSSIYDNSAIYFGIDFRSFSFTTVTGPMDFDTAVLWALAGGLPGINKFIGYVGWDYYVPIKSGKFAGKIE